MFTKTILSTLIVSLLSATLYGMEMGDTNTPVFHLPTVEPVSLKAQALAQIVKNHIEGHSEKTRDEFLTIINMSDFQQEVLSLMGCMKEFTKIDDSLWLATTENSLEEFKVSMKEQYPNFQQALNNQLVLEALPLIYPEEDRKFLQDFLLFFALTHRNFEAANFLLSRGSNVNAHVASDNCPMTAWAITKNDSEMLEFLLSVGADANGKAFATIPSGNDEQRDAKLPVKLLYAAVESNNPLLVKILLRYSANCTLLSNNHNAFDYVPGSLRFCPLGLAALDCGLRSDEEIETRKSILKMLLEYEEFTIEERDKLINFVEQRPSRIEDALEIIRNHIIVDEME